jgi:hypothetical protein
MIGSFLSFWRAEDQAEQLEFMSGAWICTPIRANGYYQALIKTVK